MSTPLTLSTNRLDDGTVLLTVSGEIDLSNVSTFARALTEATRSGVTIVDLREVEYLDSGAINALFTHVDHIRIRVNPLLIPVLTISGLTGMVPTEL
ncbi:STAS domain-containing protein [Amycolatopsis regifaucium]|uniref:Anti-anti-sigma factor n=1 Tax=Amycolatopsis regifaucium TaxID=546365 RepID=A0A154MEV6_9PSEU|nr:STAS domain-containing protein [Amycolatopsis regifaucium]KZB83025.1 anti-anti-sigma factor [Amycolatopsis regifaucium]OKA03423.1 anti-anti-sigma factor [Amycolatopsis regifaucium]SFJ70853.1 anti-anti-sigma factor [Amycolatopsis regifaucium]